jgi:hypothetical protein
VSKYYLDLGQGILQCLDDIYKKHHHYKDMSGLFINDD